jgi:hypothetical protein
MLANPDWSKQLDAVSCAMLVCSGCSSCCAGSGKVTRGLIRKDAEAKPLIACCDFVGMHRQLSRHLCCSGCFHSTASGLRMLACKCVVVGVRCWGMWAHGWDDVVTLAGLACCWSAELAMPTSCQVQLKPRPYSVQSVHISPL